MIPTKLFYEEARQNDPLKPSTAILCIYTNIAMNVH